MPVIRPDELFVKLKQAKPIPAILLLGDEVYLRDECRAKLIDRYVSEAARTWALSRFSAERGDLQSAIDQAQTIPMLSPQQVIFLEDAEAIEEFSDKKRDAAVDQLEAYLDDPAPFTVFVVEAAHLDQRMRLGKRLVEKTLVVQVGLGDDPRDRNAAAVVLAKSLGREQGIDFAPGAAEDLAESVAADLQRLKTEIEKLATYAGAAKSPGGSSERKTIRREDVSLMVISEKAATVWEMADLIAARRADKALDFLHRLLRDGEEPLQMLGALAWVYRKLIEASEIRGNVNGWQAARVLQMPPDRADLAVRNARQITKPRLLAGMQALQRADDRLKSGERDPNAIMEFLVTELTAPATRSAAK